MELLSQSSHGREYLYHCMQEVSNISESMLPTDDVL